HDVAEAAVVGYPHDIKGQGMYAYVTLKAGVQASDALNDELKKFVGHEIGPIAKPDVIQFAPGLPKTRSGKIMRRILRKIAEGDTSSLGDTSTLADPSVVDDLVKNAKKYCSSFSGFSPRWASPMPPKYRRGTHLPGSCWRWSCRRWAAA